VEVHRERLTAAGFAGSSVWFQCFNFASILAFKGTPSCEDRDAGGTR
jgi:tRNA (cmo5U34)-methyltransferase